ncbi:uncharacterized protein LOC118412556 [Branchiostoma floridae]|uniref:Uncharacterized protein LOC118412556 n=1 Tax=Branchiostoma floridae TaxID=7739 RepID=A0A9J7KX30_BRAFL|nr:uncharacterized protein LOC118412556 [Branchiostoma floridae]
MSCSLTIRTFVIAIVIDCSTLTKDKSHKKADKMTPGSLNGPNGGNNSAWTRVMASLKAAKGILLSLMSAIFLSFCAEFIALASKAGIPGFQILFLMRLIELLTLVPILAFCRPKLMGENRYQNIMLFLFVIIANFADIVNFLSFTYTVPGIAFGIIQGSMPFFVSCIGSLFLNESLGILDICAILLGITGVVLLAFGMTHIGAMSTKLLLLSIIIPVLASFANAPDMIMMRYLRGTLGIPITTSLLHQDLYGTVVLLAITYTAETPVWKMPLRTVLYVIGLGVSKFLAIFTVFAALEVEKAYIPTALRMFVIPISLLLDYCFLEEVPNSLQVAGVTLVILGLILISGYTWWTHRQEELQRTLLETLYFDPDEN